MSKKLSLHAYIYKVENFRKTFKKIQKNVKKPLTSGDVCDIMSVPLPKGFFVVRIFSCNTAVIVPPKTGLTASPFSEGGTQTFTLWTSNKIFNGRCR